MADPLAPDFAMGCARQLKAIPGFPWDEDVIVAHARYLLRWCKGSIGADGSRDAPDSQAQWLVDEAVSSWEKWQGTTALYKMFRSRYEQPAETKSEWTPLSCEETITLGLIKAPCGVCDDALYIGKPPNMTYCTACGQGRHNAKWNGDEALHRLNARGRTSPVKGFANLPAVTPEGMARAHEELERYQRQREAKLHQQQNDEAVLNPSTEGAANT
jgi:hypothetical protein